MAKKKKVGKKVKSIKTLDRPSVVNRKRKHFHHKLKKSHNKKKHAQKNKTHRHKKERTRSPRRGQSKENPRSPKRGRSKGRTVKKRITRIERVPTWISNFDKLIGGGFSKNSTNLVVGGSGSGKSIFATQFIVEAMKKGEKCLYVTFEEKKEQFYENMRSIGWDLEDYEKKGLFVFLEYTPMKVKTMLEEGGGAIESIILKKKISRIVIDSITSFVLLFGDEFTKREAALSLFSMIRGWDCTSLLTLEEDPTEHRVASHALEFEVDSIIAIYFIRDRKERQRFLEVLKMRGTDHSKKIYPFDINKGGISIKKNPVNLKF